MPNADLQSELRALRIEAPAYAVLLAIYFWLALPPLARWLPDLYAHHRTGYALAALACIIAQGVVLEEVARVPGRLTGAGRTPHRPKGR